MLSDTVRFWSFLFALIPSTLCTCFVLYHLLFDRVLRRALHNHVILLLLFICLISQMTIYPWMLYFYQHEDTWQRPLIFCTIWGFLDWGLYIVHAMLFAWATIERHILIFHDAWVSTKRKRFFVHYCPVIFLLVYLFIFYFIIYFFPPCENYPDPSVAVCMFPCFYDNYILTMWDYIVEQFLPTLTIIVFSIGLLVRVIWRKVQMRRTIHWHKHRKMAVQLLSISFVYLLLLLPYAIVYIVRFCGVTSPLSTDFSTYTVFISYFILLFFPFVCAFSLPELQTKMRNIFRLRAQARQIRPAILTVRTHENDHIRNQ
jgi:uncharacterized membrane protein YidH (DUF202 family)